VGLLAACRSRAGQQAEADKLLDRLGRGDAPGDPSRLSVPEVLILNNRVDEAISLLSSGDRALIAIELLGHREELAKALALAEQRIEAGRGNIFELRATRAFLLGRLGEKRPRAPGVRRAGANGGGPDQGLERWAILIRQEVRAGLNDRATVHCTAALEKGRRDDDAEPLLEALFSGADASAVADLPSWWGVLRTIRADEPAADTLMRLKKIVERRISGRELEELAEQVRQVSASAMGERRTACSWRPAASGSTWIRLKGVLGSWRRRRKDRCRSSWPSMRGTSRVAHSVGMWPSRSTIARCRGSPTASCRVTSAGWRCCGRGSCGRGRG